ncbi:uncharacterized protein PHALS_00288 [Plasmopara halstedii]|uniref:Uncharacterized protein n=1 Tax=Plasmopara halstedii TaxID=4781 RepID=A0A0P1A729_PLAHL|nr:uncharacterized protein PHALS_00288 [Plasmopara halstedii]CEG35965.1 hypothetical protein PHALS_00288 [Plasmopara halstedii]|eukprot:XP_024572334.1 hypothetical protein PHALS_00288 [Plasmopara halstedii]
MCSALFSANSTGGEIFDPESRSLCAGVGCILTGKDLDTAASCAIMFGWAVKLQCWAPDFNLSTLFRT